MVEFVCLEFPWGEIPLKSKLLTIFYENQYLSAEKEKLFFKSKVCDFQDLLSLPLNKQKSNLSHALDINLLQFVS